MWLLAIYVQQLFSEPASARPNERCAALQQKENTRLWHSAARKQGRTNTRAHKNIGDWLRHPSATRRLCCTHKSASSVPGSVLLSFQ